MGHRNLEELLEAVGNPVEVLRNAQVGPNVYPGVPAEYTNWRDEQIAWQETCVLYNQTYHMAELMVEGPDAIKLVSSPRRPTASRPSSPARPSSSCRARPTASSSAT